MGAPARRGNGERKDSSTFVAGERLGPGEGVVGFEGGTL